MTLVGSDLTGSDLTMERSDRNSEIKEIMKYS